MLRIDWIRTKARFGPGMLWFEDQRRWEERSLRMMIIDSLLQFNFFLSGEVQENLSLFVNG